MKNYDTSKYIENIKCNLVKGDLCKLAFLGNFELIVLKRQSPLTILFSTFSSKKNFYL